MSRGYFSVGWPPHELRFAQLGPDLAPGSAETSLSAGWRAGDAHSRAWYHAAWTSNDSLLAGHRASPEIDEFAAIDSTIGRTAENHELTLWGGAISDSEEFFLVPTDWQPSHRGTNYVLGGGMAWAFDVEQEESDADSRRPLKIRKPSLTVARAFARATVTMPATVRRSLQSCLGAVVRTGLTLTLTARRSRRWSGT